MNIDGFSLIVRKFTQISGQGLVSSPDPPVRDPWGIWEGLGTRLGRAGVGVNLKTTYQKAARQPC